MPSVRGCVFFVVASWLAVVGFGCGDRLVFIETPWPEDHLAVVILTDGTDIPTEALTVVPPGERTAQWSFGRGSTARLFVRSWAPEVRADDGRSLFECGVTIGGPGPEMPAPTGSWSTPVLELDGSDDVVFVPEPQPIQSFDLKMVEDCREDKTCPGFEARALPLPDGFTPRRIVHLGDYALIAAPSRQSGPTRLARATPTRLDLLAVDPRLQAGTIRELVWDPEPPPGRVLLVYKSGRVIVLDRAGGYQGRFSVPRNDKFNTGVDGESMLLAEDGLYRLAAGATVAVPLAQALPPFVELDMIDEIFVERRQWRMIRVINDLFDWTPGGWQASFRADPFDVLSQIGADRDIRAVVGEFELVRIEDPVTGVWTRLSRPFDQGHRLRSVGGLLEARFVVAGEGGGIAVWNAGTSAEDWCVLPYDGPVSTLTRVATSTLGRDAYAIGTDEEREPPVVVHIEVPDP